MAETRVLHIVRHAKSSWDYDGISDIDRPLKLRGIRNAYEMARRIKISRNMPGLIISSPANRALHTANIFIRVFEYNYDQLKIDFSLYGHGTDRILKLIHNQDKSIKKLMVFGHNPDFSDLASYFSKQHFIDIPTCGLSSFTFNADSWKDIGPENMKNEFFDFPNKE